MVAGHLQEKNGNYYIVLNLTDLNGKRRTKWVSTGLPIKGNKKKAEMLLLQERQSFQPNSIHRKNDMLFADYMLYWLKTLEPDVEVDTFCGYESNIKRCIAPYFRGKNITLSQLKAIDIQEFYTYCRTVRKVSNNTVIHYHANLSKALKYALKMDLIQFNPMDKVSKPKSEKHIGKFYSLEEMETLFRTVRGDKIEFAVLMAAFYGLRQSEITGLRWQSIDFENNIITIEHTVVQAYKDGKCIMIAKDRAKNKSSCRSLPLVPQYRELLLEMKAHQAECRELAGNCWHESDYVYVNDLGVPVRNGYISQHFASVVKKNSLRKITFHELRHSCASLLLKNGVSMKEIQAWLGHSNYNTTANIYAHLDTASKKETGLAMAGIINIEKSLKATESGETGEN